MNIKPIKTEKDYQLALKRLEVLWEAKPNTKEADELDILATLIEVFEEKNHPVEAPDPVEAIKFRMEQQGLQPQDLVPYLGQRSRVTEILNRKRKLSINMIRNLNKGLKIPLESLIQDYSLQ